MYINKINSNYDWVEFWKDLYLIPTTHLTLFQTGNSKFKRDSKYLRLLVHLKINLTNDKLDNKILKMFKNGELLKTL